MPALSGDTMICACKKCQQRGCVRGSGESYRTNEPKEDVAAQHGIDGRGRKSQHQALTHLRRNMSDLTARTHSRGQAIDKHRCAGLRVPGAERQARFDALEEAGGDADEVLGVLLHGRRDVALGLHPRRINLQNNHVIFEK